jgi:hypothetical protein
MNDLEYLRVKKLFTFRDYLHMFRQLFPQCLAWNWRVVWEDVLQPAGIISREQFGYPAIINEQIIVPVGIVSSEVFGSIMAGLNISPSGIASSEAFGTAVLTNDYGFYLYDDFENSAIKNLWNSAFYNAPSNWSTKSQAGQIIAYSPDHSVSALFPQLTSKISGDFEVKWQFVIGTDSGGNVSLHIQIKDPTDGHLHGNLYYIPSELHLQDHITDKGIQSGITAPKTITCKMVRIAGVIWTYYNDDVAGGEAGNWVRNDAWSTPGSSISFSGDCVLEIDGDDGWGGYGFIEVKGDALI